MDNKTRFKVRDILNFISCLLYFSDQFAKESLHGSRPSSRASQISVYSNQGVPTYPTYDQDMSQQTWNQPSQPEGMITST